MNFTDLLKNKYVLYFVLFVAFSNLLGFINTRNVEAVAVMLIAGLITSYFFRNMIVILFVSILAANIYTSFRVRIDVKEGMENKKAPHPKKNTKNTKNTKNNKVEKMSNKNNDEQENRNKDNEIETQQTKETMNVKYPKNLDDAYNHLQSLMENGNLTKETQSLLQEQKQLMETLQTMTPTLNNAMGMLKSINNWMPNMSNLNKLLGSN